MENTPFVLRFVDFSINITGLEQLIVRADRMNFSVVQHDNLVGVLNGGNALRDDNFRRVRDVFSKRLTDQFVGFGVNRAGRVVQNQDFGLFQQRPRNTQSLLLASGYIGAALLVIGACMGFGVTAPAFACAFNDKGNSRLFSERSGSNEHL
jgi:hypothetical protein